MNFPTYHIETLADLFVIPCGKRAECLRQMAYAMELHTFAVGDTTPESFSMVWVDDGLKHIDLSINGEPTLTLEVTEAGVGGYDPI